MPERLRPNGKFASPREGDEAGGRVVGRFALGERVFIVALAPESPHQVGCQELARFEVAGLNLVVLEKAHPGPADGTESADDLAERLTGRELEVAVLVAQGYATKNIAYRLRISEWTVATYVRRLFLKLDVDSRAAMVYRCAALIDKVADARFSASQGCVHQPRAENDALI